MAVTYHPLTSAGSGYTYTVGNASATTWATTSNGVVDLKPHTLSVKGDSEFDGDANFQGDLKVKGKSIKESLDAIEKRLAILHPNEELEEKWDNLRGLRQAYMELEAEIIEKEKMWSILKK